MRIFKTLKSGDESAEVRLLQRTLPAWAWPTPERDDLDGKYGPRTVEAVTRFQKENDLGADGIAGQETLTVLGLWSNVVVGMDISDHQGQIQWSQVTGVNFAIIKASEGVGWNAKLFNAHYSGARSRGLKVGAYHYARMGANTPWAELDNLFNAIGTKALDLPVALDLEADFNIPPADALQWTLAWLTEAERRTGKRPIVYTSRNVTPRLDGGDGLEKYPLWYPKWGPQPVNVLPWTNWHVWQYTSTGQIPGIAGNVDLNYMVV